MKITQLSLDNVRAFKEAEFTFNPSFNLIIGINGAGKSTALDTIRYCGSFLLTSLRKMPFKPFGFVADDIHGNAPFAQAALHITFDDGEDAFVRLREWREAVVPESTENVDRLRREILETERLRDRPRNQLRELQETVSPAENIFYYPSAEKIRARAKQEKCAPLMVHYSTSRSFFRERKERSSASAPDQAAFYEALGSSTLNLRLVAEWLRAQDALVPERPASAALVKIIEDAIGTFLPGYSNLRTGDDDSTVLIDHNGMSLNVRQLSDGERSLLSLVLDLAKRLAQANPASENPLAECEAIVLIDEIDLHLHPKWQRKVVGNLERTFPNCQFIATTHSPQVIGEVPHEKIRIIREGKIFTPEYSFGIDSSRVLEELMETAPRNTNVEEQIGTIARLIADGKREHAISAIDALSSEIGEDDPEITRARTLLDFMEDEA